MKRINLLNNDVANKYLYLIFILLLLGCQNKNKQTTFSKKKSTSQIVLEFNKSQALLDEPHPPMFDSCALYLAIIHSVAFGDFEILSFKESQNTYWSTKKITRNANINRIESGGDNEPYTKYDGYFKQNSKLEFDSLNRWISEFHIDSSKLLKENKARFDGSYYYIILFSQGKLLTILRNDNQVEDELKNFIEKVKMKFEDNFKG